MRNAASRSSAVWAMVAAAMLVGTTGTAQALGPHDGSPLGVGAARGLIGAVALWVLVPDARRWNPRSHRSAVALGAVGVAAYQLCFFVGVDRLGVALGTILAIGSGPVFAGLLAAVLGRPPSRRWLVGTVIAVIGASVMLWARGRGTLDESSLDVIGVGAALGAGFGYALYTTITESLGRDGVDAQAALTWQFTLGSVVLVPVLIAQPLGWLATPRGAVLAIYLGVVTVAIAYVLVGYAVPRLGAPMVTTLFQVEPLTASVLAIVVLGERLPLVAWIAAAAIVGGVGCAASGQQPVDTSTP